MGFNVNFLNFLVLIFYKQITQISEIKMEHRDKEHWEDAQKVGTRMVDTLGY